MKKIGIFGSGIVGQTLGSGFMKYGYSVMIGSREPDKLSGWKSKAVGNASVGSVEEAARYGDLLVLAVKGDAAEDVLRQAGPDNLKEKTVIDTTNPIAQSPAENGVLKYFTRLDDSLMERLQKEFPDANFVKAFNIIGNAFMVNPNFPGGKPTMFYCGNNETAKSEVRGILEQFGHEPEDMGKAEAAAPLSRWPCCGAFPGHP
jgi:predicted dinucleotide-binding enzyme